MLLDMQNCVFTVQRSIMQKKKKKKQSAREHNMPFGTQTLGWSQRADPFASSLISRNHRAKDGNAKICGPHSAGPACLRKSEAIRNDLRKINGKSRLPLSSAFRRLCRCNTHTQSSHKTVAEPQKNSTCFINTRSRVLNLLPPAPPRRIDTKCRTEVRH